MDTLQPPPPQASSHPPLEPVSASVLAQNEADRRDAVSRLGTCKTGCAIVDEDVLLGGFERASVVGVSAEDEEIGVQVRRRRNEISLLLMRGAQSLAFRYWRIRFARGSSQPDYSSRLSRQA